MDDLLVASSFDSWTEKVETVLTENFKVKYLGLARDCLGFEIQQNENKIYISPSNYNQELLERFHMTEANPVGTPLEAGLRLVKNEKASYQSKQKYPYRELIEGLMYLSVGTRPNITHAISVLSQFNDCHEDMHWRAAKRILRYLIGTQNAKLIFKKSREKIDGYVDVDWRGCHIDRRSYTGYMFTLGGAATTWESRKQRTIALSSAEAEYMALAEAVKKTIYLRNLMLEM